MISCLIRRILTLARPHAAGIALVLLFVVVSVQYSFKAREERSAFLRWREQLLELNAGVNVYQKYLYPNPPIMAMLLLPLALLPPLVGSLLWFYLKAGMTLLAIYWVFRLVETPGRPFPPWAKVVAVLLSLRPILGDLSHGNVNLLILFLVIACLYAFRRRWDLTAGVSLALAVACKVTPALFVPYLVWKRAWKPLAGCALGLVLFFAVVPAFWLGPTRNLEMLGSWADVMIKPFLVSGKVFYSEHNNQSVPGLVHRLLTESPSFSTYDEDGQYVPLEHHNLVTLEPAYAGWIIKGCMVAFAALGIWTCRTPTRPRANWRLAAEYSLVLLGMLLFSERTWKHHCVTLLLPFTVLVYYLATCRPGPALRGYLVATLAGVTLLMSTTSTSLMDVFADGAGKVAQVYGAYTWAFLALSAALAVLLHSREAGVFPSQDHVAGRAAGVTGQQQVPFASPR